MESINKHRDEAAGTNRQSFTLLLFELDIDCGKCKTYNMDTCIDRFSIASIIYTCKYIIREVSQSFYPSPER